MSNHITIGAVIIIVLLLGGMWLYILYVSEYKMGEKMRWEVNYSCRIDNDCMLINKTALDISTCWKGACEGIDYSTDDWMAANTGWVNSVSEVLKVERSRKCGPAPACPSFIINDNFKAACVQQICKKVPSS